MVRSKGVRITLLVEDKALARFAREVLLLLGFHRREMRFLNYPVGRGSAKHWVENQYAREVKVYRSKAGHQKIALLVGTDADEQTVRYRFDCLAAKLKDARLTDRVTNDRIVLWIPKWNVETWILHLAGEKVDEDANYKTRNMKPDYRKVAKAFVDRFRESNSVQSETLPSLKVAFMETARLDE